MTPSADILLPEMRPYKISNVHNTHIFKLSLAQEHRYTHVYINTYTYMYTYTYTYTHTYKYTQKTATRIHADTKEEKFQNLKKKTSQVTFVSSVAEVVPNSLDSDENFKH